MAKTSKKKLFEELLSLVRADLAGLEAAQKSAVEGATHPEAKPENDKDTRGLEQSYLARGQGARIEALRDELTLLISTEVLIFPKKAPIAPSAVITIEDDGKQKRLLLAPAGAGKTLDGGAIQVITPSSPLGKALNGRVAGTTAELKLGAKTKELKIIAVE